jgi:transcriptional regulator with XRE-family HTH domain
MSTGIAVATFSDNLREARARRGFSQEELARRSGVPRNSVYRYEAGMRDPRLQTVRRLAEALEMSTSELVDGL